MAIPRGHVLDCRSSIRWPTDLYLVPYKSARRAESNGTNVISVGHLVYERRPNMCVDSFKSETYVAKKKKKSGSPVRLSLMPPDSSRAYFNPLNETNGTYKDNFLNCWSKL